MVSDKHICHVPNHAQLDRPGSRPFILSSVTHPVVELERQRVPPSQNRVIGKPYPRGQNRMRHRDVQHYPRPRLLAVNIFTGTAHSGQTQDGRWGHHITFMWAHQSLASCPCTGEASVHSGIGLCFPNSSRICGLSQRTTTTCDNR